MLPPVVKNLLIINALFFLAMIVLDSSFQYDLGPLFALHYPGSHDFGVWQFVTYMFMHGGFYHILLNMFALWMFGNTLENVWGGKRFLNYYLITGIGAGLVQVMVAYIRIAALKTGLSPEDLQLIYTEGYDVLQRGMNYQNEAMAAINIIINTQTVGASGAVFGILLAFGMMFPNSVIYIYFAIPIKAKYFVMLYGAFELYSGIANSTGDDVAHFAHLGGMVFGFFLIQYWKKKGTLY
ncbi:MAG: rhomboid family intramembrane serine protease [Bacteroidetes bacterium]|nr:MAG: rhomboid family intramembrane serine protease [Bacteroidota bacterium]